MKGNTEEARSLNAYLDSLRSKTYDYHQELVREDKALTAENFRSKWLETSESAA